MFASVQLEGKWKMGWNSVPNNLILEQISDVVPVHHFQTFMTTVRFPKLHSLLLLGTTSSCHLLLDLPSSGMFHQERYSCNNLMGEQTLYFTYF